MSKQKMTSQKILMVCIVALLVANLLLTVKVALNSGKVKSYQRESLPCQAVPIQFVMEEPECADKLLRSMNVSNVRVMSGNTQ